MSGKANKTGFLRAGYGEEGVARVGVTASWNDSGVVTRGRLRNESGGQRLARLKCPEAGVWNAAKISGDDIRWSKKKAGSGLTSVAMWGS